MLCAKALLLSHVAGHFRQSDFTRPPASPIPHRPTARSNWPASTSPRRPAAWPIASRPDALSTGYCSANLPVFPASHQGCCPASNPASQPTCLVAELLRRRPGSGRPGSPSTNRRPHPTSGWLCFRGSQPPSVPAVVFRFTGRPSLSRNVRHRWAPCPPTHRCRGWELRLSSVRPGVERTPQSLDLAGARGVRVLRVCVSGAGCCCWAAPGCWADC